MKLVYWDLHVIIPLCSLSGGNLTDTGAMALARVLQENKSLKELKWVVNWVLSGTVRVDKYVPLAVVGKFFILPPGNCNVHYQVLCLQNIKRKDYYVTSLFAWNEHARFVYVTNVCAIFYEFPNNWGHYGHTQTVCTRPLLGGEGAGNKASLAIRRCQGCYN